MPRAFVDMAGRRVGDWLVLDRAGVAPSGKALWRCRCKCGRERVLQGVALRSGTTKRCRPCSTAASQGVMHAGRVRGILRVLWKATGTLYSHRFDAREEDELRAAFSADLGFDPADDGMTLQEVRRLGDPCPWEPPAYYVDDDRRLSAHHRPRQCPARERRGDWERMTDRERSEAAKAALAELYSEAC